MFLPKNNIICRIHIEAGKSHGGTILFFGSFIERLIEGASIEYGCHISTIDVTSINSYFQNYKYIFSCRKKQIFGLPRTTIYPSNK